VRHDLLAILDDLGQRPVPRRSVHGRLKADVAGGEIVLLAVDLGFAWRACCEWRIGQTLNIDGILRCAEVVIRSKRASLVRWDDGNVRFPDGTLSPTEHEVAEVMES